MKRIKVAFLIPSYFPHVNIRAEYLIKNNFEVYYFCLTSYNNRPVPNGVYCVELKGNKFLGKLRFFRIFRNVMNIRSLTKEYQIDILHIYWLPHCINALFSNARKHIFEIMGSDILVMPWNSYRSIFIKIFYRIIFRFADGIVQDSKIAKEAGLKLGATLEFNEIIETGIDLDTFNLNIQKGVARNQLGIDDNRRMVFSPRSIMPLYNIDIIIKTILLVKNSFPDVIYIFCSLWGDFDDESKELLNHAEVKDNIRLVGFLDHKNQLPYYYADANVVVSIPSSDSSPSTVYEALACGASVIISELPWYHGKLEAGRDLETVPVRNIEKTADTIIQLLSKKRIERDIQSTFQKIFNSMSQSKENDKMISLYQNTLNN